ALGSRCTGYRRFAEYRTIVAGSSCDGRISCPGRTGQDRMPQMSALLLAGVPVEEGVDLVVVHAGERAAGERREHVRVHAGARPGAALPPLRGVSGCSAAAGLVGTARLSAVRRLASAPPPRVVERHPDRDREAAAV